MAEENFKMKKNSTLPVLFFCFLAGLVFFYVNSTAQQAINKKSDTAELIFQSGFEGTSTIATDLSTNDYGAHTEYITGIDSSFHKKNNWDWDWKIFLTKGTFQIQYTGGDSSKRFAKIIAEPAHPDNHVLQFWLNDSWLASEGQQKARIQANLYGINKGCKDFYQSVRVFLTEDFSAVKSYPHEISWCTIAECWNNEWWVKNEPYGFRITLGIGKPSAASADLNFIVNAENAGQKEVWNGNNTTLKVPIGKWFTMEYYFKEGNKETGRFWMAITPDDGPRQVVFDIHNFTHNTTDPSPNGVTGFNPMKLYTSKELVAHVKSKGKTLQVYWDDFKLWKNKRPE